MARRSGRPLPFSIVLGMFVVSGATGLIDQLCFSKYLGTIVGSTAHAVSAVLAAFMTGLALGAHLGGRLSRRIKQHALGAYGVLELLVALAVVLTPVAFGALGPLYLAMLKAAPNSMPWLSAARWLVAMLLVVAPTMAMGATLPFLSSGLAVNEATDPASQRLKERRLSRLYAANTLGGALGALVAAYLILPALGLRATLMLSALLSGGLGIFALWLQRRRALLFEERPADSAEGPPEAASTSALPPSADYAFDREPRTRELVLLSVLALISGALVFCAEVIFTHLLALIIGNSVYAFGLILAIFLCCLFIGASAVERVRAKYGDAALPVSLGATALALMLTLPLWDKLPLLFNNTGEFVTSFLAREATRGVAALLILLVPTTLMGLTFPLLLQRIAGYTNVGGYVGRLTAINTLGAVLGSLVAGYLLLPWLGSERSLKAVAACFALGAGYASWALRSRPSFVKWAMLGTLLVGALLPRWDLNRLTAGTNVYFDGAQKIDHLLMLREDVHGGVTSVSDADGVRTLYTNGKFQGNTGWEMNAQRYFAHYPSLFVPRFEHALVIGLGTGTTAGTLAAYPWQHIDIVEISPAIVEAARTYFTPANDHALEDPRVKLVIADGRNHLLMHEQRYDLITIELSSIWFAGASSLYSWEFYDLVVARLAKGGVLQQWVQLHHITPEDFATILNTMRRHFPHMALYYGGGQGIVVASGEPLKASLGRAQRFEADPRFRRTLPEERDGEGKVVVRELSSLVGDALLVNEDLDRYLQAVAKQAGGSVASLISSDDNLYLEYATPRGNVLPWSARDQLVSRLTTFRTQARIDALSSE